MEHADLLSRLLVADPAQRLSVASLQSHPWFTKNLPPRALSMNDTFLSATAPDGGGQSIEEIQRILHAAQVRRMRGTLGRCASSAVV